ncbi:MAG: DUF4349 domain-containing protein [Pseudomonadota bacterium]
MRGIKALVLATLLVGCGQAQIAHTQASGGAAPQTQATDAISAQDIGEFPDKSTAEALQRVAGVTVNRFGAGGEQSPQPAPTGTYLAYTYGVSFELPADHVAALMDAHVHACEQAGPQRCQLVSSNRTGDPESAVSGTVEIRGEPTWLQTFRGGLAGQVGAAGGKIVGETRDSEDLTRDIVDTEARLRAAHTLRDRLQRLLASRPGKLSDLLDIERELARVQGEIDSTESNLAVMRARVDMSVLTLNYASSAQSIRSDTFKPLGDALAGFVGWIVIGIASIITVVAILLPWALVIWGIVWLVLFVRRRMGGRFFKRRKDAEHPPAANS